jgi:hypothetical protein
VRTKVQGIANGQFVGAWTWRLNSDSHVYENIFQVWLYNTVHRVSLPGSRDESIVAKFWRFGGRDKEYGRVLPPEELK